MSKVQKFLSAGGRAARACRFSASAPANEKNIDFRRRESYDSIISFLI
jgi:hypothetical protein